MERNESAQAQATEACPLYKDATRSVEERVEDLLGRMTLEEKVAQLCGNLPFSVIRGGKVDHDLLKETFPNGHGRITQFSTAGLASAKQLAGFANEIQRYFVEETRLGIPVALQTENLCGYPGAGGTLFPSMTNLAATWEPELARKMSAIIGEESRSVGINSAMSPVIDVSRDPRWGRTYETFGEDPYLVTQFGINYISGMQSAEGEGEPVLEELAPGEAREGVACIAKHFLGYAETQGGLNCSAARFGDRELYEVFATPFEAAAKLSDVSGMMANYGEIDGLNVCANPKVAKDLLRDTMGFKGMLTSDGAGVMRLWNFYHIAESHAEAGYIAKKSGVDTEIPVGAGFAHLLEYVAAGKLDESVIDESVRRILAIKFAYGLFEHPYVDVDALPENMTTPEKQQLSARIAADSLVLLKNDGTLPLAPKTRVALVGPHADSLRYPVSGYTYPAYIEMIDAMRKDNEQVSFGGAADEKANAKKSGGVFASFADCLAPEQLDALEDMNGVLRGMGAKTLREELSRRFDVAYAQGCEITDPSTEGFAEAVAAAEASDVAVLALGGNCGWVNVTGGEGKDRSSIELPGVQQQLLEAVVATGKPVVVVLYGPGVFGVEWAAEHAGAIMQAWMPGQHAAEAVAKVLAGEANPTGKLPVTVPRNVGQVPIYYNHKVGSGYNDGADATSSVIFSGGYTDCPGAPLYPFGFGLSYTTFEVSDLSVAEHEVACDGSVRVSATVRNTGERAGAEVVQLYTAFRGAHVTRPNRELRGFARVALEPGEARTVTFDLSCAQLAYYNEDMRFCVEPGTLDVMVGTSSAELPLRDEVALVGEPADVMGKRSYVCDTTVSE